MGCPPSGHKVPTFNWFPQLWWSFLSVPLINEKHQNSTFGKTGTKLEQNWNFSSKTGMQIPLLFQFCSSFSKSGILLSTFIPVLFQFFQKWNSLVLGAELFWVLLGLSESCKMSLDKHDWHGDMVAFWFK